MNSKSRTRLTIALAGSAVDPFHLGHLALLAALMSMDFDIIYWVVSGARKGKIPRVGPDDRVTMTLLAIPKKWLLSLCPRLKIVFIDAYGRNTPTITWLRRLHRWYPAAEVTLVTGADSVCGGPDDLKYWDAGAQIYEKWKVLVFPRVHFAGVRKLRKILKNRPNFSVVDTVLPDVASREICTRIGLGKKRWTHLVPRPVALFIKRNHLYGNR
ncbi:MAG: hypothetical protein AAB486_00410 [Patescibacteria group bacterium]